MSSNRYGNARGAYREVQERHAEIQKIERTLTELAQMFSEMSMLVEQQDEAVVNIETQAQGVDHDINEGCVPRVTCGPNLIGLASSRHSGQSILRVRLGARSGSASGSLVSSIRLATR